MTTAKLALITSMGAAHHDLWCQPPDIHTTRAMSAGAIRAVMLPSSFRLKPKQQIDVIYWDLRPVDFGYFTRPKSSAQMGYFIPPAPHRFSSRRGPGKWTNEWRSPKVSVSLVKPLIGARLRRRGSLIRDET